MVITNLEHLSLIALENDRKNLDRKTSRKVKGGIRIKPVGTAVANAKVQGIAKGSLAAVVAGSAFTFTITP